MVKICNKSKSIVNFKTSDLYLNCVTEKMVFFDKKDWNSSADKGHAFIGLVKLSYKTNTGQIVPLSYNDAIEKTFDENEISLRRCDPTYSFRTCSSASINPSADVSYGVPDSIGKRSLPKDAEYPSRDIDVVEPLGSEMTAAGAQATPNNDTHKYRRQEREPTGHQERRSTANGPLLSSADVYCTKKCTDYRKPERPHEGPLSIIFSVDSLLKIDDNSAADHGEAFSDGISLVGKPSLIESITISKSLLGISRVDDHQASVPHDSKKVGDAHLYQTIPLDNFQDLIKELVDNYITKKREYKIAKSKRRSAHGTSAMRGCTPKMGYIDSTSDSGSNLLLDSLEESDTGNLNKKRRECNNYPMCPSLEQLMQVMMYKRDGSCHPIYSDRNNYKPHKEAQCNCPKPVQEKKNENDDVVFVSLPMNKLHPSAVALIPKENKKPSFFQRMRAGKKKKQDADEATTVDGENPSLFEVTVKRSNSVVTQLNDGGCGFNTVVNVTCPHHSSSSDDSECSPCCKRYQKTPTIKLKKPSKIPLKKVEEGERNCCMFKRKRRIDSASDVRYVSSCTSPLGLSQNDACHHCCNPNNAGYSQWAPYQPCHYQPPCPPVPPQYRYCDLCSNGILHNWPIDQYNDDYNYTMRQRRPSFIFSETPKRSASKSSTNSDPQPTCCMRRKSVKPKEDRIVSPVITPSRTLTFNGYYDPRPHYNPVMSDKAINVHLDHSAIILQNTPYQRLSEAPQHFSTNTEQTRQNNQSSQVNFETPQCIPEADRTTTNSSKTNKDLEEQSQGRGCCSGHFFKSKPSNASIKKSKSRFCPEKKPIQCSKGTCNCARDEKCISCACSSATVNYTFSPTKPQPERATKNCACLERNSELKSPTVSIEVGLTTRCIPLEDCHSTSPPKIDCLKPQCIQQPEVRLRAVGGQTPVSGSCLRNAPAEVDTQGIVLSIEDTRNLPPRPVSSFQILYPQKQLSAPPSGCNKVPLRSDISDSPATLILRDADTCAPAYNGKVNNYVIKMYPGQDRAHTRSGSTIKRLTRKMDELEGVYYDTLQKFQHRSSRKVRKHVIKRSVSHSKTLRMLGDAHPRDRSLDQERRILHDVAGGVDLVLGKLKDLNLLMNNHCCH